MFARLPGSLRLTPRYRDAHFDTNGVAKEPGGPSLGCGGTALLRGWAIVSAICCFSDFSPCRNERRCLFFSNGWDARRQSGDVGARVGIFESKCRSHVGGAASPFEEQPFLPAQAYIEQLATTTEGYASLQSFIIRHRPSYRLHTHYCTIEPPISPRWCS